MAQTVFDENHTYGLKPRKVRKGTPIAITFTKSNVSNKKERAKNIKKFFTTKHH